MRSSNSWRGGGRNRAIPAPPLTGPLGLMIAAALATGFLLVLAPRLVPSPLVLPLASVLLLATASALAVVAWRRAPAQAGPPSYWDVSGALVFAGIGAALLSEPEAVLPLIESGWLPENSNK